LGYIVLFVVAVPKESHSYIGTCIDCLRHSWKNSPSSQRSHGTLGAARTTKDKGGIPGKQQGKNNLNSTCIEQMERNLQLCHKEQIQDPNHDPTQAWQLVF